MAQAETQAQLFELPPVVVSRIRAKHTGIKDVDSLVGGERYVPQVGDRGTSQIEWVVEKVEYSAKRNAAGEAIGPMTATAYLKALSAEVMTVDRKADR
jgi:hypothetical protein